MILTGTKDGLFFSQNNLPGDMAVWTADLQVLLITPVIEQGRSSTAEQERVSAALLNHLPGLQRWLRLWRGSPEACGVGGSGVGTAAEVPEEGASCRVWVDCRDLFPCVAETFRSVGSRYCDHIFPEKGTSCFAMRSSAVSPSWPLLLFPHSAAQLFPLP